MGEVGGGVYIGGREREGTRATARGVGGGGGRVGTRVASGGGQQPGKHAHVGPRGQVTARPLPFSPGPGDAARAISSSVAASTHSLLLGLVARLRGVRLSRACRIMWEATERSEGQCRRVAYSRAEMFL
nr:unnamed protein product [Digitaria exilis]